MTEPLLEARDLWLPRRANWVLDVPHLTLFPGEILTIIGPNGAGKSTLVAILAALLPPQRGEVRFRGQPVNFRRSLAYRRRIAVVLQRPYLLRGTVEDNVALGLRLHGVPYEERRRRTRIWMERLGIQDLARQSARRLSGGQAQRVALARALALEPEILFLDEPFQALDVPTRMHLLEDLRTLLQDAGLTAVYVTHDLNEGLALAHRVAVLVEGKLRQVGTPEEVLAMPADCEVARLVGVETFLSARVTDVEDGLLYLESHGLPLMALGRARVGDRVRVCLRPEALTLWRGDTVPRSSARNRIPGRVVTVWPQGALVKVVVEGPQGMRLVARITRPAAEDLELQEGQRVWVTFKASAAWTVPEESTFREGPTRGG